MKLLVRNHSSKSLFLHYIDAVELYIEPDVAKYVVYAARVGQIGIPVSEPFNTQEEAELALRELHDTGLSVEAGKNG